MEKQLYIKDDVMIFRRFFEIALLLSLLACAISEKDKRMAEEKLQRATWAQQVKSFSPLTLKIHPGGVLKARLPLFAGFEDFTLECKD